MPRKKKQRGRPPVKPMPPRIDASPERIAEVVLGFNPTGHDWQYMKGEDGPTGDKPDRE